MLTIAENPSDVSEPDYGPRRSSSARAVLQALALLARSPDGLRADETAEALGRSVSTAYSLLDSLCQEGFAVHEQRGSYRLAAAGEAATARDDAAAVESLTAVLDELYTRTNKRAYLATVRRGTLVIPATRGRQGMRRMRGLGREIGDDAHALALGKVALSALSPEALAAYVGRGLRPFTEHTIVRADRLFAELEDIRQRGLASDQEEYELDFCCLAAPVLDAAERAVAIVGISMSQRSFTQERAELEATVLEVARRARLGRTNGSATALPENARRS
ncbi:MAG: IclR family transcriptional regulator C-terminal domain-containing protein [Solirubrobacteraceae bacterium]